MHEIVIYSKPGCGLCDKVKHQLRRLQPALGFKWREVSILDDAEAYERFKDDIPVVFINGEKAFQHHLDERQFAERLRRAQLEPPTGG